MPVPLVWLGAGLLSVYAGNKLAQQMQKSAGHVAVFPGESDTPVQAKNGSVVCCGVYNLFEHSGIWVDGQIIELSGTGLIRAVSPERFLADRSGEQIFVACDYDATALNHLEAAQRAVSQVFQYREYSVLENNCHRFCWQCIAGYELDIVRFAEFNEELARFYGCPMHWHPLAA